MRSPPGWSTSTTCSSGPSWWAAASSSSPTGSGSSSNCWTSVGSATAWCTCATAPTHEQRQPPLHRRGPGRGARTEPSLGDGDDQGDQDDAEPGALVVRLVGSCVVLSAR